MFFQSSEKRGNVALLSPTTPNHRTLMADSVQWLSQSDRSTCISIQVEFHKLPLDTDVREFCPKDWAVN